MIKFKYLIINLLITLFYIQTNAQVDPKNVKIARDQWGVPHIMGKTDADAAYGLAWAHAEDDFETIQLTILAGKQMLGRHLGKNGASVDYVVGLIKAKEQAEMQYNLLSAAYQKVHQAYVAGINAYAAKFPEQVLIKGSFPITKTEALAASILSISVFSGLDGALKDIFANKVPLLKMEAEGSNSFAFNSNKTKDGSVFLNNNSHQPLEGPQSWYEAHIMSDEGWNCLGGLFPGATSVLLGTNTSLGWAHTVNHHDKMDVFQLELNPQNKNQYKFDNQWVELEQHKVKLSVKTKLGVIKLNKKAWWSKYGPTVVNKQGHAFALRYAALFDSRCLEQWYKMNKANNFTEFKKAMEMTAIPGFNTVYADKNDTIFYVSNGKIPLRNPKYDWKGTLPGNTSTTLWTAFHPFADLPQIINPASGYVFNTNNTPFNATAANDNLKADNFDKTMGIETFENNRSRRFMELIAQYQKLDYEDFKRIKFDRTYPINYNFDTDLRPLQNMDPAKYTDVAQLINTLKNWDRTADLDSKGAALFVLIYNTIWKQNIKLGVRTRSISETEFYEILKEVEAHMKKYFKKTDPTLGEVQKLVRGKKQLPNGGLPDVLAAMYGRFQDDGTIKSTVGESYIQLVQFKKGQLPILETVMPYGASNKADSPHYADQMELYTHQKLKKMTLDKEQVLKEAKRVYTPE